LKLLLSKDGRRIPLLPCQGHPKALRAGERDRSFKPEAGSTLEAWARLAAGITSSFTF